MSYISVDDAIRQIGMLGPGIILAKINIESAFRLIPVHPADGHLLAMEWKGSIYFDTCLPFSLRPVPKPFNVLADLLEWILVNQGATHLLHYLDDLTLGPLGTLVVSEPRAAHPSVPHVGNPFRYKKVEGPTTCLDLCFQLDATSMEARLPKTS